MRPMPAPLGLYIHIPFCKSKCVYCDFYSLAGREDRMDAYQKALLAHIRETAPLAQGIPVDTVYFGGGAALRPEQAFSGGEGRRDHGGGKP